MRPAVACLLLLVACGHERAALVSAHATRTESGTQIAAEHAIGTLTCPNVLPQDLGSGDVNGDLRAQHVGAVPLECTVTVALSGYQPFTARVADVCKEVAGKACASAEFAAVLAAATGSGPNAGK
jgi:hypothetical protein